MPEETEAQNDNTLKVLKEFVDDNPYLKLNDDNNLIEGIYMGVVADVIQSREGDERPVMRYSIEVKQKVKELSSSSKRLAEAMLKAKPRVGEFIRITRIPGESQYDTQFTVETSDIPF